MGRSDSTAVLRHRRSTPSPAQAAAPRGAPPVAPPAAPCRAAAQPTARAVRASPLAPHLWRAVRALGAGHVAVAHGLPPAAATAETTAETAIAPATDPIAEMRAEMAALERDYRQRMARLEERLAALEAASPPPAEAAPEPAGLEALRAAALEAAAEAAAEPVAPEGAPVGRERNLNRLNPEISMTGIVLGIGSSTTREEFEAREFEVDLQAALDPFSRTRLTLAFREGEVEIEEGYVTYSSLPGRLELAAGRFRQRFGPLNRQHLHALPQSDYPLALQTYFGEEGLGQTGVSLTWLLARPWASANELTLEITDGENEVAFAGESFEDLAVLGRLKNFWELGPAAWFEWGLTGIAGRDAAGGTSRVWGTDLTYHWQPPARAKYRELTWRSELLLSQRDDAAGGRLEAWGGYSYLEGLVRRNLSVGLRLDRAEDPLAPGVVRRGVVPYLTWWQSEYVRLRGEYQRFEDDQAAEREDRFLLQLTWAAGPHKHETY